MVSLASNSMTERPFTLSIRSDQPLNEEVKMKYEAYRLQTYQHWQYYDNARPMTLAKCGFFYSEDSDIVTCFSCGLQKGQWSYRSNPEVEHKRLNPECLHIRGQDIENIPILVPNEDLRTMIWDGLHNTYCSDDNVDVSSHRNISGNNSDIRNLSSTGNNMQPYCFSDFQQVEVTNATNGNKLLFEAERLKTFDSTWPHLTPTPAQLAYSGFFFTGGIDRVQCMFCNGILKNWKIIDIPIEEHRRHFPACPFINNYSVGNIPISIPISNYNPVRHVIPHVSQDPAPQELSDLCSVRNSNVNNTVDMIPDNGIHTEKPRHPEFATEASRLASFRNWPCEISQTPQELAKAGFYYAGFDDSVKCFFCDGGLRTWDADDDPWTEHARWFSRCSYVLQVKGQAFVQEFRNRDGVGASSTQASKTEEREILARMDRPVVQSALAMDIPRDRVMSVIREKLLNNGDDFPNLEALLNAIYHAGDQPQESKWKSEVLIIPAPLPEIRSTGSERETAVLRDDSMFSGDTDSNADHESLLLENQRLKEQRTCKICMDEEANIVLLPCGHLVSCGTCAPALRKCPICRANIKGTVRTYLS